MRFAMIGTRGVPAKYGGFETAVEEIGQRLVERGHEVTVYCRNPGQTETSFRGMDLVNLPAVRHRAGETLSHSGLSVMHAVRRRHRPDAAVVFNAANAPYLGLLKLAKVPTAIHMDGIEWKRAKWAGAGAKYYRWAERSAAVSGLALIADAQGIADHLRESYGQDSYVIPYGAPILRPSADRLADVGLEVGRYHLVVARMEPENHVDLIVEGYARSASDLPLVVVGSTPYGDEYVARLKTAGADRDVRFLGAVWDQELLNQLYAHCRSYLHGHSVGGTNPSLLRAMGCGAPVSAYDVNFNHEVTGGHARYFRSASEVADAIAQDDHDSAGALRRGRDGSDFVASNYRWDDVTDKYEALLTKIAENRYSRATRR